MRELGVWEPYAVKVQTIKTAVESAVRGRGTPRRGGWRVGA